MPPPTASSGAPDAPEQYVLAPHKVGQVAAHGSGVVPLSQRHKGNALEGLALDLRTDRLLRRRVGRIQPRVPQALNVRVGGPAEPGLPAIGAQRKRIARVCHPKTLPRGAEE